MEGEIDTNKNSVGKLPAFYRIRHILRIRPRQNVDLVGNMPAGKQHPNIFYV